MLYLSGRYLTQFVIIIQGWMRGWFQRFEPKNKIPHNVLRFYNPAVLRMLRIA
jgi:hypothetical protein